MQDIIQIHKQKFGQNINFLPLNLVSNEYNLKPSTKTLREHIIKTNLDLLPSEKNTLIGSELSQEETILKSEILYEILSETIKDFEQDSLILGDISFTQIGVIGVYQSLDKLSFDIIVKDSKDIFLKLKSNSQKLINLGNKYLSSEIKDIKLTTIYNRLQIHFTHYKEEKPKGKNKLDPFYKSLKNKVFKSNTPIISLGLNSDKELILEDLNYFGSIGIAGMSKSGKSELIKHLLYSIYIFNPQEPIDITIVDKKADQQLKELSNKFWSDDYINYMLVLNELYKEIKERKGEFKTLGVTNFKDAKQLGYIKNRKVIVLEDLPSALLNIKEINQTKYHHFRELLEYISCHITNLGLTLIYTTQRTNDENIPKKVNINTNSKLYVGEIEYSTDIAIWFNKGDLSHIKNTKHGYALYTQTSGIIENVINPTPNLHLQEIQALDNLR